MKFFRQLLTALCLLPILFPITGAAQERFSGCGITPLHEKMMSRDATYRKNYRNAEQAWAIRAKPKSGAPPYTLPLVFHIVHQNGSENISDADIDRSVGFVNQAFANTDYFDQGTGTDTQLQFCRARRSPDNQPTNGITRIVSPLTEVEATAQDRDLKDLQRWEPRDYINVWVVKEICGLGLGCSVAGYAYYPSAHGGSVDGIVVEARWLAGDAAKVGVLVHELGHYLGLRHTFAGGCKNDDCTVDGDAVCDTPPDGSKAAVPCTGTANSCTTDTDSGFATDQNDMFINYMDYGYFRCYSAFTPGQRDRMHFFLEGRRKSLLTSFACLDPCPAEVTASFTGGDVTVEVGTTVSFTNTSTNGADFVWRENGSSFAGTDDATRTFATEGTYRISLLVESNDGLCRADSVSQTVRVVCSVAADFTVPGRIVASRDTTFTNTSTGADRYTWTVDGNNAGSTTDLTFTFPTSGIYEVCLLAANDGCRRELCRRVFVSTPDCTDCPEPDPCDQPYFQTYRLAGDNPTNGTFTALLRQGNLTYAGGPVNDEVSVVALGPGGNILWQRDIVYDGTGAVVTDMLLDREGFLAGVGHFLPAGSQERIGFAFRLSGTDGQVEWIATYRNDGAAKFLSLAEGGANQQEYLVVGEGTDGNQVHAGVWNLDRADGSLRRLPLRLPSLVRALENTRSSGTSDVFAISRDRQTPNRLLRLRADGTPVFSVAYFSGSDTGVEPVSITADGNELVLLGQQGHGSAGGRGEAVLWKVSQTGELRWSRSFLPMNFTARQVILTNSGYLISGYSATEGATYLLQTDRSGNLLWARRYTGLQMLAEHGANVVPGGQAIMLAGSAAVGGFSVPAILQLGADGSTPRSCIPEDRWQFSERNLEMGPEPIDVIRDSVSYSVAAIRSRPGNLKRDTSACPNECLDEEICDNQLDDDGDGRIDCEDPDLVNNCCCLAGPRVDLGRDTTVCFPYLTGIAGGSTALDLRWSDGSAGDSLLVAEPGIYWVVATDSCGRFAADTLTLHPRPRPLLDLGPDTVLCSNAVVPFYAQDGFRSYEWVDGSREQSFTAYEAGTYWVIATDSCGGMQTDTVRVGIEPATVIELGPDLQICRGDTIEFSLTGFSNYQWSQSSYIDCFSCSSVRFFPTRDTLLLVAATSGPGCISADSVHVRVEAEAGTQQAVTICAGDDYPFGGTIYTTSGMYLRDIRTATGCQRTDTLLLTVLPASTVRDTVSICRGDSALIHGVYRREAGQFTETRQSATGCDSTVTTVLEITDNTLALPQNLEVRSGDSVWIFPMTNREPPQLHWLTSEGQSCIACPVLPLRPETDLTVYATTLGDCPAVDSTFVRVIPTESVYLPTAFSPNDDGVNDRFEIFPGPGRGVVTALRIYQRWGSLVFSAEASDLTGEKVGWSGNYANGLPASPGVYVFTALLRGADGGSTTLAGEVLLLR